MLHISVVKSAKRNNILFKQRHIKEREAVSKLTEATKHFFSKAQEMKDVRFVIFAYLNIDEARSQLPFVSAKKSKMN